MATQNRFFRAQGLKDTIEPFQLPAKELAFALERQQSRFDEGETFVDELSAVSINALPSQRSRANELISGIDQKVDDIVGKYDGDFARANKDLRALKRDVARQMGPGGEMGSIKQNFDRFTAFRDEQMKRKDITSSQLNNALSGIQAEFAGKSSIDPQSGNFKQIGLPKIAAFQNLNQLGLEAGEALLPQIIEEGGYEFGPSGWITKKNGVTEELTKERVSAFVSRHLAGNLEVRDFVMQTLKFRGIEPTEEKLMQFINEAAVNAGNALQVYNIKTEEDIVLNPYKKALFDDQLARGRIKYKHNLESSAGPGNLNFMYGPNQSTGNVPETSVTLFGGLRVPGKGMLGSILDSFTDSGDSRKLQSGAASGGAEFDSRAKPVWDLLADQGINLSEKTREDANDIFSKAFNDYYGPKSQVQGIEMGFKDDEGMSITNEHVKSMNFTRGTFEISKDGKVTDIIPGHELGELYDTDSETLRTEMFATGYNVGLLDSKNGIIMSSGHFGGDKIVMRNTSAQADRAYLPYNQISQVYNIDSGPVEDIDLSVVPTLAPSYFGVNDDGTLNTRFTAVMKDGKRSPSIINSNGKDITSHSDFNSPVSHSQIGMMITQGLYSGQSVISVNEGSKNNPLRNN